MYLEMKPMELLDIYFLFIQTTGDSDVAGEVIDTVPFREELLLGILSTPTDFGHEEPLPNGGQ